MKKNYSKALKLLGLAIFSFFCYIDTSSDPPNASTAMFICTSLLLLGMAIREL